MERGKANKNFEEMYGMCDDSDEDGLEELDDLEGEELLCDSKSLQAFLNLYCEEFRCHYHPCNRDK